MNLKTERLNEQNIEMYLAYLKDAMHEDPENMTTDVLDEKRIRERIKDPFYNNTKSIIAVDGNNVAGRIEYHFYGCIQDGVKMCYVDWVYVKKSYRHNGVAQLLFKAMEADCRENKINQYYLIRAENPEADSFYNHLTNASLDEEPFLRKDIQ